MHPLSSDLSTLSDQELDEKIRDLGKKSAIAHRLGSPEMLTQLQNLLIIYREEFKSRYMKKSIIDDQDLDKLINVD